MAVFEFDGIAPQVHPQAWVADSAQVIGRVSLAADSSVWFGTVIRADVERIDIAEGTNIQDLSVLHADKDSPLILGRNVTIGHRVILHSCTIGEGTMIGMGSTIINGAVIGKNCLVGANSLITNDKTFADGSLIMGSPAIVVRTLSVQEQQNLLASARHYVASSQLYASTLHRLA